MKTFEIEIEGTCPLLQHKMPEEDVNAPLRRQEVDKHDNPEDFLYNVGGKICQPATCIERSIVQSASSFKIVGRGKKTYKDAAKTIFITPEMIPHTLQDWRPYSVSVVIPSTKGRVIRSRPRFDKWKLVFHASFDDKIIPAEIVKKMLDYAGENVGIGDWRPRFGRFMVTSFKPVK